MKARFDIHRSAFGLQVDLDLPAAGITAIFGASGSGKTTLLRAIAGLDRWNGGLVHLGTEVWQDENIFVPVHERSLGFVFQEPGLFNHLSVRKNLEYGRRRAGRPASDLMVDTTVGLMGLEGLLDRSPATLSGGERQRVAIARALSTSPRVLFMDEPLASIDDDRKADILPFLLSMRRELDIPVLYVTHSLHEVIHLADHLVLLEEGLVRTSGPLAAQLTELGHPLAHRMDASAVATVRTGAYHADYGLTEGRLNGEPFWIPGGPWPEGTDVRVRLAARDVSITLTRAHDTSIQNILPCTITAFTDDEPNGVTVSLAVGSTILLARITRKSLHELDLAPGQSAFAQIKGVAILA